VKYKVSGTTMQVAEVELESGEAFYTEVGGMAWMSDGIKMDTNIKGGVLDGLKRKLSGESIFMTTYTAEKKAKITFAGDYVGRVVDLNLKDGESVICQKDAFMCAQDTVKLQIHMQKKLGAGLFGGEGFILQKITGPGLAFLELAGEIVEKTLEPGEILKVDTGYVGAFEPTVEYNIERIKGVRNLIFGGEGIFLATLKGPGKVWLQTMPLPTLAGAILKYLPIPKTSR
jgi:uncharacterized protein (TIGR00266 family)